MRRIVAGSKDPECSDDPGQTRQRVQGRGSCHLYAQASADIASKPPVKDIASRLFQVAPMPAAGVLDGRTA